MGAVSDIVALGLVAGLGWMFLTWHDGTGQAVNDALTSVAGSGKAKADSKNNLTDAMTSAMEQLLGTTVPDEVKDLQHMTNDMGVTEILHNPGGTIAAAAADVVSDPAKQGTALSIVAGGTGSSTSTIGKTAEAVQSMLDGSWEWTGFKPITEWGQ